MQLKTKGGEFDEKDICNLFSLFVVLTLAISAFAEESVKVKGKVTKIDVAAKSVTIQPKEGDAVTVVMEDADLLSKVKEGEKGQATYVSEGWQERRIEAEETERRLRVIAGSNRC